MRKSELVRELAEEFSLPRRQVDELVTGLLDKITEVLSRGDKVQLTPFGQFKVRDRAARIGRNPQTGAPVKIPAKRVLRFLAGRALKEAVGTAKPRRAAAKKAAVRKKATAKKTPVRKAARKGRR
jgi:DNA-binding protein HU-beta